MRMKKLLTFLTLLMLFYGVGWAEESLFYKLDGTITGGTNGYATVSDITQGSMTWKVTGNTTTNPWRIGGKSIDQVDRPVYSTTAMGNAISKVSVELGTGDITIVQVQLIVASDAQFNNRIQTQSKTASFNSTIEFTPEEGEWPNGAYYKLNFLVTNTSSTNESLQLKAVNFYKNEGGSTTETCAAPTFSPATGTYYEPQSVTLSCTTPGSTIYYTTDGSTPTTSSAEYSSAITVSETTTIKAIATADGMDPSSIATAAYTIASSGGNTGSGRMTFVQTSSSAGTLTNAPSGVTATFSNTYTNNKEQITKGNTMTLTISGMPSRYKITGVTLNVHNNASSGNGSANITMNGTSIGTMTITGLGSTYSEQDVNITECPFTGDLVITLNCTTNSVYCNAFYIDYEEIPAKAYDVTVTQGANGTITASPSGQKVVDAGDKITVTATPDPGYELDTWTITGAQETEPDANNQITATGDVTITASFKLAKNKVEYTIAPTNSGTVWLESGAPYDETLGYSTSEMGTTVTIKLVPYSGYEINTLTITDANGATVSYTTGASDWSGNSYGTHYTFTMPATAVTIAATFKNGDIYILGTANDNAWAGNVGVPMTFNATANTYTARVYFKGDSDADEEVLGYGRFSFADRLGNADWSNMGKRFGANGGDNYDLSQHNWSGGWTDNNQSNPNAFMLPAGIYDITVNWGTGVVSAVKVNPTVSLDKASGTLEAGTTVNVSSNLTTLLSAIKSGVSATLAYSTDNGSNYTDGSSFDVNSAMTAKGKAYYGYIEAESDAYEYTVVTHYAVTATANPTAGGTVTVSPASALAGETVTITATPKSGYELTSITVNGEPLEAVEGVYSFTMPAQAVEVVANFSKINYTITTSATKCTITGAPATANAGDVINFTVTPSSGSYEIRTVTVTWDDGTTGTVQLTNNGDGNYSFTMVAHPVTITAVCAKASTGDGSYILVTDASTLNAGDKVIIANSGTAGSALAMAGDKGNNRDSESVTITSDLKITPGENVQILTLESTTATVDEESVDGWMFNTGDGKYLYAGSSSNNYLKTGTASAAGENGKATISIGNSNNAVITFRGSNTRNIIRNNGSLFACYSSGQSPVYLYKQTVTGVTVSIEPNGGDVVGTQNVVVDASTETAVVRYKVGENGTWSEWAEGPVNFDITGNVGDTKVVYAEAKEPNQELEPGEEEEVAETDATFHFVLPDAPSITPASCSIASETQTVTITSGYADGTIEYSTDGGATWTAYNGQFNVVVEGIGQSVTVQARVTFNGVVSEVAEATYTRGVQPVVFSPASGTYYGDQTCQMFSTTKGARIYYTTDGSEPVMNQGTTQLYTGEVAMPATGTYNFKAVAYIGTTPSEISSVNYTIKNTSEYVSPSQYDNPKLYSVAELNAVEVPTESPYYTTSYYEMVNPVQVIYMSTYKQNGYQPEFCLVRDNTGYGMIYFGKQNTSHNNYSVFNMGDWIGGGYSGQVSNFYDPNQQVLSDTHPELGRSGSGKHIYNWVDEAMSNSAVLPEYLTIQEIKASDPTGAGNDYWGHYVHLRKNTIELVQSDDPGNYTTGQDKDGKWSGTITDENGQSIMYYDKFYLQIDKDWTTTNNDFTGHPNRTFDVYGFVACYKNVYQVSPFDFAWIDKPVIDKETATYYEPQTVTLNSPEDPTATIWYKTDDMDDYAVYTEPFEVNSTTTVSWYATKKSQYNDELESLIGSITMTFEEIAKPVISPESNVYAVGESVDASIAFEAGKTIANGAEIVYTTDGSDPKTSETAQVYTLGTTMNFTTTTTVRAITRVGSGNRYLYSAEAEAKTYTFVKSNGIEYTLIDDVTKLKENGVYVIVSQNYSEAMSTIQNVNNRGAAGVLFVEGTNKAKVYGNDDVAQFTLTVLTHDEDTSPERHFLMQTNNSNVNGYLYVGNDVNNSLMTEAEEDAMGNDVAVITIDSDGRAHIHFNYAGGDNRYLQYWNRDRLFNTYKTEYDDRAVYIYGVEATPLATIEREGVTTEGKNQYTIADELVVVWANPDQGKLWCKDQGNVSIAKTDIKDGQVDYMKEVGQQHGEWDQSNWVLLQFPEATSANGIADLLENAVGKYIEPATVSGKYVDSNNYTIEIAHAETYTLALKAGADTTKNVYCTANFLPGNLNINGGQGAAGIYHGQNANYFFMNPKIQEICSITFAEYAGENTFVVPYNDSQIDGAFTIDWSYNEGGAQSPAIGTAYRFVAVVNRTSGSNYLKGGQPSEQIVVYPLDFKASSELPTAINTVDVNGKAVKSVKYVNVAGMVSDKPFSGVNIVVTEYTDGSRSTTKMLRK